MSGRVVHQDSVSSAVSCSRSFLILLVSSVGISLCRAVGDDLRSVRSNSDRSLAAVCR